MFGNRPSVGRSASRSSPAMLAIALATTTAVILLGSIILWRLYESGYASPESSPPTKIDASAQPLRVGIARTPGGPGEWITFAKVLAQLERDLNRPVIVRYSISREDQMRLFQRREIDVALMSALAYVDVHSVGGLTIIAVPVVLNEPTDAAVMVVLAESDVNQLGDLRDKRYAVSADLAGVSFTYWLLTERGENPKRFFSVTTTGSQDVNLAKVSRGEVDATSVRRSALAAWPKGMFRIIEKSPDLGIPPFAASKNLDDETLKQVRRSLLSAAYRGVIPTGSALTGFRTATNEDYDFARVLYAIDRDSELEAFGSSHQ